LERRTKKGGALSQVFVLSVLAGNRCFAGGTEENQNETGPKWDIGCSALIVIYYYKKQEKSSVFPNMEGLGDAAPAQSFSGGLPTPRFCFDKPVEEGLPLAQPYRCGSGRSPSSTGPSIYARSPPNYDVQDAVCNERLKVKTSQDD
jgi:hypothetical protein